MSRERILSAPVALLVWISVGLLVSSVTKAVVGVLALCAGS